MAKVRIFFEKNGIDISFDDGDTETMHHEHHSSAYPYREIKKYRTLADVEVKPAGTRCRVH